MSYHSCITRFTSSYPSQEQICKRTALTYRVQVFSFYSKQGSSTPSRAQSSGLFQDFLSLVAEHETLLSWARGKNRDLFAHKRRCGDTGLRKHRAALCWCLMNNSNRIYSRDASTRRAPAGFLLFAANFAQTTPLRYRVSAKALGFERSERVFFDIFHFSLRVLGRKTFPRILANRRGWLTRSVL